MGAEQVTIQNLDVVSVDPEFNLIAVCGAVPGPKGGIVYLKSTVKTIREKKGEAGTSVNPQKASARANPAEGIRQKPVRKGEFEKCLRANVYNMAGQQVGEVELSEGVFGDRAQRCSPSMTSW